jgi:hypothetical protein
MGFFPSIEEVQEAERDADDDIEPLEPESTKSDADDFTPESMDEYISASVLLPRGEDVVRAKVVGRMHRRDGNSLRIGTQIRSWTPGSTRLSFRTVQLRHMPRM